MFKLLDKPAFERRVEVRVPVLVEGENAFETQTFTAHFLAVDIAERAKEASDVEILKEVWIGWAATSATGRRRRSPGRRTGATGSCGCPMSAAPRSTPISPP